MRRSYIADEIAHEYKRQQIYQKKQRAKCKEQSCDKCKYNKICTESNNEVGE